MAHPLAKIGGGVTTYFLTNLVQIILVPSVDILWNIFYIVVWDNLNYYEHIRINVHIF